MTNPLASYYTDTYYQQRAYHAVNRYPMAELLVEALMRITRPKKVLDVGCAKGFLVQAFRERGIPAFGFDLSEFAVSDSPVRAFLSVCDAENDRYPYRDNSFNLVTAIECMEHLTHPENAIREMRRVVKIGGHIAIASPRITLQRKLFQVVYPNPVLHPSELTLGQWRRLSHSQGMQYERDFTRGATKDWLKRYRLALLRMALPLPAQVGLGFLLTKFGRRGNLVRAKLNNWFWQPEFMLFRRIR